MYIENIQKDLIGITITEDFIISSVDIIKEKNIISLCINLINVKTNKQIFLRDSMIDENYIINIFNIPNYDINMHCLHDGTKMSYFQFEHGLLYYVKTRELKYY